MGFYKKIENVLGEKAASTAVEIFISFKRKALSSLSCKRQVTKDKVRKP